MNKLLLTGRLTKDPITRGNDDNKVCLFTVAVKRHYSNQNGEYETDFVQVKALNKKLAKNCSKYLQKGSLVSVEGFVKTGSYEKDGEPVYTSENVAEAVRFLGGIRSDENNNSNDNDSRSNRHSNQNRNNQRNERMDEDPFAGSEQYNSTGDNDWPFS